jgi:hypothetical protein
MVYGMNPGLHVSPYFTFRNMPEVEIIRIGNFELYRDDDPSIHPVYYRQYLVSEITTENNKKVVYMEVD